MQLKQQFSAIKQSPILLVVTALILVVIVNIIDLVTGPELSTSIFYLLPVALVAWKINRQTGLVFAVLSALIWLITDISTNPFFSHPLIPFWNALVRLGFFVIVVLSLTSLRKTRDKEREVISFIVHDLRSPLGNMLAAMQMLERQTAESGDEDTAELISIAAASGQRMLILINSLLDLERLEGGKMPVKTEAVELRELFNRASGHVRILAEYKSVELVAEKELTGLRVRADIELTERVLVNLFSNAIKFSPQKGIVSMSASIYRDDKLLIGIRDRGPGIPAHLEKQVFSRFGQVEGQKSGSSAGTGLGLTFCKLAIEAQNGRIWLDPQTDKGTLICFTLPVG